MYGLSQITNSEVVKLQGGFTEKGRCLLKKLDGGLHEKVPSLDLIPIPSSKVDG
jgi:hypothetical protein